MHFLQRGCIPRHKIMDQTQSTYHDLFRYDEFTGLLVRRRDHGNQHRGAIAGLTNKRVYAYVYVDNRCLAVHRIIWHMVCGPIPKGIFIDHIDGNRLNNRLANLRLVTYRLNNRNVARRSDNSSGVTGVYYDNRSKRLPWKASIHVDGKHIHLGQYSSIEEAIIARKLAEPLYDFHQNHGRTL